MGRHDKMLPLGLGIVMALLLVRCSPPELCTYGNVAKAWIDANENGQWDNGETPLAGVQIIVNADAGADEAQGGITDDQGEAKVGVVSMSCSASFSICVEPPPGYRLTTQDCYSGGFSAGFFDEPSVPKALLFGFVPDPQGKQNSTLGRTR